MIRRPRLPKAFWTQLLWVSAALWALAAVVTERVLELHEGPLRTGLVALATAVIACVASFAGGRLSRSWLRHLPWLLVAGMTFRLAQRRALRAHYEASAPHSSIGPRASLWHPVTTTDVVVRSYALSSNRLFSERLRLVSLADFHLTRALPRAYYEHVFELVKAQAADLILLSGDYVSHAENMELMAGLFARHWPARLGAFAVLGNHDLWTDPVRVREVLVSAGVTLVEGRCERLPAAIGRIAICGSDTPWGPELSTALDRSELNVVLSHTPDNIYRLAEQGASLVFSGHTHGGQIRLPGFGSVVVPSRFGGLFDAGHFLVDGAELFVSAGVGADLPALRIYCQPEILVVDITRP
jgi:predicted MPP superfamily phosphohydrolase